MNIILVDDNSPFREALKMYLEIELKYVVFGEYESGKQMLESANLSEADLLLLDLEMPEMDGMTTMKELRKENTSLKVIAISNHCELLNDNKLFEYGFTACIAKNEIYKTLENKIQALFKIK